LLDQSYSALMKNLRIVSILLTLWLMGSLAGAQSQDWQVVEELKPRTLISVEDMHRIIHDTCRFQGVVDGQLLCEYSSHPFGSNEIAFRQQSVRAVRKEHNSTLIGLAIGAGAGAIIGASRNAYPGIGRGGSALVGAGLLGGMGALGGSIAGHICHGRVIYRNPNDTPPTSDSSQPRYGDSAEESAASRPMFRNRPAALHPRKQHSYGALRRWIRQPNP
jgi:hypothetical protein